jgi:hypothetical protein
MRLKTQLLTISLIGFVYPLAVQAESLVEPTTVSWRTSIALEGSSNLATVHPALKLGAAVPSPSVNPSPVKPSAKTEARELPGWLGLLIPIALLGGLALWWKNRRAEETELEAPHPIIPPPPIVPVENDLVVTPPANEPPDEIVLDRGDCGVTLLEDEPPDEIADFLDSLVDPDLDTSAIAAREREIDRETMDNDPFPLTAIARDTFIDSQETELDLSFFTEDEEDTGLPSEFASAVVPLAAVSASGVSGRLGEGRESTESLPVSPGGKFIELDARSHCYELDARQLLDLESRSNGVSLDVGTYTIKITEGLFCYGSDERFPQGEPLVLLWIFGGRFINLQTNVEVGKTWVSLNGYEDSLVLRVLEPTRLCGLFFDTDAKANQGQIILSIS